MDIRVLYVVSTLKKCSVKLEKVIYTFTISDIYLKSIMNTLSILLMI